MGFIFLFLVENWVQFYASFLVIFAAQKMTPNIPAQGGDFRSKRTSVGIFKMTWLFLHIWDFFCCGVR